WLPVPSGVVASGLLSSLLSPPPSLDIKPPTGLPLPPGLESGFLSSFLSSPPPPRREVTPPKPLPKPPSGLLPPSSFLASGFLSSFLSSPPPPRREVTPPKPLPKPPSGLLPPSSFFESSRFGSSRFSLPNEKPPDGFGLSSFFASPGELGLSPGRVSGELLPGLENEEPGLLLPLLLLPGAPGRCPLPNSEPPPEELPDAPERIGLGVEPPELGVLGLENGDGLLELPGVDGRDEGSPAPLTRLPPGKDDVGRLNGLDAGRLGRSSSSSSSSSSS